MTKGFDIFTAQAFRESRKRKPLASGALVQNKRKKRRLCTGKFQPFLNDAQMRRGFFKNRRVKTLAVKNRGGFA
jgi:hypothetical protein